MSNQIKLTIDVSDELLSKLLSAMTIGSQQNPLGAMLPMMLAPTPTEVPKSKEKAPIGFNRSKEEV